MYYSPVIVQFNNNYIYMIIKFYNKLSIVAEHRRVVWRETEWLFRFPRGFWWQQIHSGSFRKTLPNVPSALWTIGRFLPGHASILLLCLWSRIPRSQSGTVAAIIWSISMVYVQPCTVLRLSQSSNRPDKRALRTFVANGAVFRKVATNHTHNVNPKQSTAHDHLEP